MMLGPVRWVTSRPHETEADLQQMYALLMEGRSRTNDWRYWHVGELAFGFFMIDCHLDPTRHVRTRRRRSASLSRFSISERPTSAWLPCAQRQRHQL